MNATYVRVFSDKAGESHFEDVEIALEPQDFAPPAAPANIAPFLQTAQSLWFGVPPGWGGETFHPVPERQIMIVMQGSAEVTTSDGEIRRGGPGMVALFEDTAGKGHSTHVLGDEDLIVFVAVLA